MQHIDESDGPRVPNPNNSKSDGLIQRTCLEKKIYRLRQKVILEIARLNNDSDYYALINSRRISKAWDRAKEMYGLEVD